VTQPTRPRKGAQPEQRQNPALGAISALVVVAVFVALGFVLAGRAAGPAPVAIPTVAPFAAAPTVAAAEPTAAAASTADRNGKYKQAPPMTIDPAKSYTATITTPRGDIVIKLRPDLAPKTVNSFVFLAREGFYNGLTWHRVIPGFVAQGGDPTGTGIGGPGYTVPGEFTDKVLFDKPGILAMARPGNDINGNGSQFYITTAPTPSLNNQYTIFGEVVQGLDITLAIPTRDPDTATTPGEQIVSIAIAEQ
jgi:peptidylprolyl isomerase